MPKADGFAAFLICHLNGNNLGNNLRTVASKRLGTIEIVKLDLYDIPDKLTNKKEKLFDLLDKSSKKR